MIVFFTPTKENAREEIGQMLQGRFLSLPAGHADWEEKLSWFNLPEFINAREVGFSPAFEWKGRPPTREVVKELVNRGIYWGIHAPNNFADAFRKRTFFNEEATDFHDFMTSVAAFNPGYIVVHGGLDSLIPHGTPLDDPIERYLSPYGHLEYELAQMTQLALHAAMRDQLHHNTNILMENTSITEFVEGGTQLPTYTHPRVGNWVDVGVIARASGTEPLCDVGHLQYSWNFFYRQQDYADLPLAKADPTPYNPAHKAFSLEGLNLAKGELPTYTFGHYCLLDAIKKINARFYHLDGGIREENEDGTIGTHAPIEYGDERIREIVAKIFSRDDALVCLEVDGSRPDGGGSFPDRPPTEELQLSSFKNLCKIVTDIW